MRENEYSPRRAVQHFHPSHCKREGCFCSWGGGHFMIKIGKKFHNFDAFLKVLAHKITHNVCCKAKTCHEGFLTQEDPVWRHEVHRRRQGQRPTGLWPLRLQVMSLLYYILIKRSMTYWEDTYSSSAAVRRGAAAALFSLLFKQGKRRETLNRDRPIPPPHSGKCHTFFHLTTIVDIYVEVSWHTYA